MTGEDRIRNYINRAFSGAPQTETVLEAKESLEATLMEKYQELWKQGNTPAAFLLFLLSINTRRLERITWLIPIAALACHQIAVLWRASCDLKKGEEDSNE